MLNEKYSDLKKYLLSLNSLAIAYSGGVDSTFLIRIAHEVLKDKCIAITARSSTYPEREFNSAVELAKEIGIKHIVIDSEELDIENFSNNPANRCYYCKKELFQKIWQVAKNCNVEHIADGSNYDDLNDYRPGSEAAKELNVVSPLKLMMLTKEEIRVLSKEIGLPTWKKPSFACLASRFPYGDEITREKLNAVEKSEQYLLDLGFKQVRVRHHDKIARIEIAEDELINFFNRQLMENVNSKLREFGFVYVCLDLNGYSTGSMNLVL